MMRMSSNFQYHAPRKSSFFIYTGRLIGWVELELEEETDLAYLRLRYGSSALWHFVPRIASRNKNSRLKEDEEEEEGL